jgi:hypothetical protein
MKQKCERRKKPLTKEIFERPARTVPFFGNNGAHPQDKEINEVARVEATQGLTITKKILIYLFPRPKTWVPVRAR